MELIDYMEAYNMLKRRGIRAIDAKYVGSSDEAIRFSGGEPIVLKVISQKAMHKTKSGLVALGLEKPDEIKSSFSDLYRKAQKIKPYRILAQKMVKNGIEIIIGGNTDKQFGKFVLLGLGGIYVETFKDFAMRSCPINEYDARSMVEQLRSKKIIAPDGKSERLLVDLLLKVSKFFMSEESITELDLNPVILHDDTYSAVDLRLIR
ncbi:acetate--CoA ligase family protein [Candidatus Marsarchaeota archaeon]|jgi:hypothetical protein|nr:acetate--CoA ligase family protein [Candidatus Marsarchaeota archaeon]MCL5092109.1 acetate--CoA ligase family protein [Candidatus Marsarchaeota archaeon]